LYMRFWGHEIEIQKVDCIDVWWLKLLFCRQGKKANLTEFS
jgi:hypothetical protein